MDAESSPFESSEMLASFLASTPFLEESWNLYRDANFFAPRSFRAERRGEVGYLAFSGVQVIDGCKPSCGTLMALGECGYEHLFSLLRCDGDGEGSIKVDAGFLHLFLEFHQRPDFQSQIQELLGKVKMIILTGHSIGATTASLTALWLLSHLQPIASPISVLCLTFDTPLLGNESLSRAILRERWGGSFCNVVSKLDVVPRLFFAPLNSLDPQLHLLLQFWQVAMASPSPDQLVGELRKQNFNEFFSNVKKCVKGAAQSGERARNNLFWPFGSYLFCSEEGAICLDNAMSAVNRMHLMLGTVTPASSFEDHLKCFEDHLKYDYYMKLLSSHFQKRRNINGLSESTEEAGVFLALQSSRIDPQNQTDEILEDIQSTSRAIAGQGSIQSPMPVIIQKIPGAEDVVVNIPTETSGGVHNQTDEILDIQSPSMAIAGQGNIHNPMPRIIQEILRAKCVAVNIPIGTSSGVQNQTDETVEDSQCLSMAIAGQGNIRSPMSAIILEIPREGDVAVNNNIETKESSGEHMKKKRLREKKEMLQLLALMATLMGSASTAFFAVNQDTYLDWLGMVFIICFDLAVVLTMLGKHCQSKRMERWGDHFTHATMVLMGVVVIAAATLRKGGDIGTRGVQNNQEPPRRLLRT